MEESVTNSSFLAVTYKIFSLPLFLIGALLVGVASYINVAMFEYAKSFGFAGLLAATDGFLVFGAIYLMLGLFCSCCHDFEGTFEFVAAVSSVTSAFAVCASVYVYLNVALDAATNEVVSADMREALGGFGKSGGVTDTWNAVQADFRCCGIDNCTDWKSADYGRRVNGVPDSCCKAPAAAGCGEDVFGARGAAGINERGCSRPLEEFIVRQMTIIEGMGLSITILCVILLVFLLTGLRRNREYQSLE